ncbi:MAG: MBL fold metallo-hydrolase [Flavobacteriales bacterium]
MQIAQFTFNPFQENTYVLYDESGECLIVDPGMSEGDEEKILFDFIGEQNLKPILVVNTHCHIDHILGNESACRKFDVGLAIHKLDLPMLERAHVASQMWGISYRESPAPSRFLEEGEELRFGNTILKVLFTPGHAPGHIVLISELDKSIIAGDVLFRGSVGRVDLPLCNASDLVHSIQQKMYRLPDDYVVYPGHGPETTIGEEKSHNAFVRADWQGLVQEV